jgi:hypothetical protein
LWLAWCWFWFSSIPFSVRNGGVFVLAGAVGGKVKISGVFSDLKMSVGAVFFVGVFVLWFFFSFFPLLPLLLPRGSILVLSEVCVRGSSTSFVGVM